MGNKKLIPVIYCHGLSSNRSMHSGTCRDLASHGYIVFVIDHEDGTSSYTVSEDGKKEQNYNNAMICYDHDGRRAQLKIRSKEVKALIDELMLDSGKHLMRRLGFPDKVEIDTSRLIISGHSFGGITAINMAKEDPRIKLCATLDPWLFAHHKEINEG